MPSLGSHGAVESSRRLVQPRIRYVGDGLEFGGQPRLHDLVAAPLELGHVSRPPMITE